MAAITTQPRIEVEKMVKDYRKFWLKGALNRRHIRLLGLALQKFHFYLECQSYILAPASKINKSMVKEIFGSDNGIRCRNVELVSYSEISGRVAESAGKKNRRDSSVRATLMEEGLIDRRWVSFTPGVSLVSLNSSWPEICCFMQANFLGDNLPTDACGNPAYYYHDSIKIIANYLHMLKNTAFSPQIKRQRSIIGMLSFCIPLGWKSQGTNELIVLCR
jgi:hypothetical protein